MATLQELSDFQNRIGVDKLNWIYSQPRGRGGQWTWASQAGLSTDDFYTANEWFSKKNDVAAWNNATQDQKNKLTEAQKLSDQVTLQDVVNNPNLNAQQLANNSIIKYWSNESEAFSRVINAINNDPSKIKFVQGEEGLGITTGEHPGYDTLYLKPTSKENIYQFSTYNQVAGGNISGVLFADPKTGKVAPIIDATKQFTYTPGQGGSFLGGVIGDFGDIYKSLGPIGAIIGNAIVPGLGTALSVAAAIDEGANPADIAKTIAISEGLSQSGLSQNVAESVGSQAAGQLAAGTVGGLLSGQNLETALTGALTNLRPTNQFEAEVNRALDMPATQLSGQDLAADNTAGNTIQDVISVIANDVTNNLTGQDLAADSVVGNAVTDVVTTLVNDLIANGVTGQDLAADLTSGNTITDVATTLVNNTLNDALLSGQDLAADTVTGNTIDDVIQQLVQDTVPSVVAQDALVSGQDLAADYIVGNTLQDVINVLNQDTITSGQDLSADTGTGANTLADISTALAGEGSLISGQDLASDLKTGTANTLDDIAIALAGEGSAITGQDLAADATAGNTLADITNVLTDTKTDITVDDVLNTLSNVVKVTALVNTADTILNPQNQETPKDGFDIVPVPTEWKSPTYNQTFTPIDLDSIFKNLQGTQYQWKPRPDITGGAFMGSPVNISDIVNKIMSAELTPTTMPSQITNAVGGILGPTATR